MDYEKIDSEREKSLTVEGKSRSGGATIQTIGPRY